MGVSSRRCRLCIIAPLPPTWQRMHVQSLCTNRYVYVRSSSKRRQRNKLFQIHLFTRKSFSHLKYVDILCTRVVKRTKCRQRTDPSNVIIIRRSNESKRKTNSHESHVCCTKMYREVDVTNQKIAKYASSLTCQ